MRSPPCRQCPPSWSSERFQNQELLDIRGRDISLGHMFILHLSGILFFTDEHRAGVTKKNVAPRKRRGRIPFRWAATDKVAVPVAGW